MTRHLTETELAEALIVGRESGAKDHLRECAECSAALAQLARPLALFRDAAASLAEQEAARARTALPTRRSNALFHPAWYALAAMALLVVLLPRGIYQRRAAPANSSRAFVASSQTVESDEALLNEIDQEIAASVPPPMQPLADPTYREAASLASSSHAQINNSQRKKSQ